MGLVDFKKIKGLQVITEDGLFIGNIMDMKYNPETWKVKGLRISQGPSFSKVNPALSGKILLYPSSKFLIADVMLTKLQSSDMLSKVGNDNNNENLAVSLYGKKVYLLEDFYLGTIDSIHVDVDDWRIITFGVKLDKEAHKPLGIKKLLFSKTISGVQSSFIASVGDVIKLKLNLDDLKKEIIIDE